MSKYHQTDEFNWILEDLLSNEPELDYILDYGISVGIIESKAKKSRGGATVFADCRKVSEMYSIFTPYDFLITIYEPNCKDFNDKQMRVLLFHELLHIGVEEEKDKYRTYAKAHDLEDFKVIIEKYGVDWSKT